MNIIYSFLEILEETEASFVSVPFILENYPNFVLEFFVQIS
ncbi:hypothetical protein K2D_23120 [Enterococcus hirae]|uniref:Uncharacterized protein n=1 Tax=Enterococcus hirae (strain ATCC 9790 / DSM 20160 / JCM 8729 / LMG 6399 / NBRC 3181 / NCIMB 6459 / NCDO 1258 / NCTC 12367 / WDCM 00089 / R) TaxID=768486 RepID=I6TBA5_ENTHA|nr:hypothetical protein EHR_08335 [Enterococcus hirae ATCC 9790]GMB99255.1 hypothetical protein K2D_23120 [Enterococcus hirae]